MDEEIVKQRIGMIMMATEMVEASWKKLCEIIGMRFWPIAIHVSPDGNKRAYVGLCDDFDEIGTEETPPRYTVDVTVNPRGGSDVKFTRLVKEDLEKDTKKVGT
jgi:hypothetical protein